MKSAKSAQEGIFYVKMNKKISSGTSAQERHSRDKRKEDYIKKIFKDSESLMHQPKEAMHDEVFATGSVGTPRLSLGIEQEKESPRIGGFAIHCEEEN